MKNKSIFLFLAALIFPLLLQAAGTEKDIKPCGEDGATIFDGCYPIYMYEDTKVANSILNSIASFFSQGSADYVVNTVLIISTAIIVLKVIFPMMFGMGTLSFFGSGQTRGEVVSRSLLYNILFILFVWLLLGPNLITRSVHVIDARVSFGGGAAAVGVGAGMGGRPISGPTIQKIDNVPIIIAFPVSTASILGKELILMMESFYAPLDGLKFTDIGFQEQYDILEKTADVNALNRLVKKINTVHPSFIDNFRKYYEDCYIPYHNSSAGAKIEGESLRGSAFKSFDSFAPVNPDPDYQLRAAYFKKEGSGGSLEVRTAQGNYLSCINFWDTYVEKKIKQIDDIIREEQTIFTKFNITVNSDTLDSLVYKMLGTDSADNVITKSKNNSSLFSQALMSPMINGAHEMAVNNLSGEPLVLSNMQMAINKSLNDTALDTTAAGAFTISMKAFPKLFLNYWIVLVALMPIGFLFMTFLGPKAGIGYLITYFGSLLIVEIARMGLALAHNIGATIGVDENIAKYNLAANTSTISPVDSQWIRDQALTANYYAGFATVVVLVTAAIVFRAGRGVFNMTMNQPLVKSPLMSQSEAGNAAARVSEEVAMMERARLNGDKDASIGSLYASSQMAQELEAANRAYGDYVKMNQNGADGKNNMRSHLFNTQQDGASAAYSSIAKGEERLSEKYGGQSRAAERVEGAARIQGISSASQEMQMGKGFDSSTGDFASQAIKDRNGRVIGQGSKSSLARAMGQNEAVKWEQSARGFVSNGAHDKDGLLNDSLEAQKYLAGLEAQSRISTNQIMGTGRAFLNSKGEAAGATRQEMNWIQNNSEDAIHKQLQTGKNLGKRYKEMGSFREESQRVHDASSDKSITAAQGMATAYNQTKAMVDKETGKSFNDFNRDLTRQEQYNMMSGKASGHYGELEAKGKQRDEIVQGIDKIDEAIKKANEASSDIKNSYTRSRVFIKSMTESGLNGYSYNEAKLAKDQLEGELKKMGGENATNQEIMDTQGAASYTKQYQQHYIGGEAQISQGVVTNGQLSQDARTGTSIQAHSQESNLMAQGTQGLNMMQAVLKEGSGTIEKSRLETQLEGLRGVGANGAAIAAFSNKAGASTIQGAIGDEAFTQTTGRTSKKGNASCFDSDQVVSMTGTTSSAQSHSQGYTVSGGSWAAAVGHGMGISMGGMATMQAARNAVRDIAKVGLSLLGAGAAGAGGAALKATKAMGRGSGSGSGSEAINAVATGGAAGNGGGNGGGLLDTIIEYLNPVNVAKGYGLAAVRAINQQASPLIKTAHNARFMKNNGYGGGNLGAAVFFSNLSAQQDAIWQGEQGMQADSMLRELATQKKGMSDLGNYAGFEGRVNAGKKVGKHNTMHGLAHENPFRIGEKLGEGDAVESIFKDGRGQARSNWVTKRAKSRGMGERMNAGIAGAILPHFQAIKHTFPQEKDTTENQLLDMYLDGLRSGKYGGLIGGMAYSGVYEKPEPAK